MYSDIPSPIAAAVADPKCASTETLTAALSFVDDIDPDEFDMLAEEHARRGGGEYSGYTPPEYY